MSIAIADCPSHAKLSETAWAYLLICAAVLLVYGNSFEASWHLDDDDNIVQNQNVHARSLDKESLQRSFYGRNAPGTQLSRPLAYLSFAINHRFGGTDVTGYHLVNFLLHLLSALVLYHLVSDMLRLPVSSERYGTRAHQIALFVAFLWAVHPIHVTAVTYIVQRMAVMAGLFMLLAMRHYILFRTRPDCQSLNLALVILFWMLAVGSKETAVLLPLSIILLELILIGRDEIPPARRRTILWCLFSIFLLTALSMYPGAAALSNGYAQRTFTLGERLLTQPRVIFLYVGLLLYPTSNRYMMLHDVTVSQSPFDPWTTFPAIAGLMILTLTAWQFRHRYPLIAFSWLFFIANHLLEGSFLPLELVFEHRNYLPSVFIFLPLVFIFLKMESIFRNIKTIRWLLNILVVVFLFNSGHTTWLRNGVMDDEISLWSDNAEKAPELKRPHLNLASVLSREKRMGEALHELLLALQAKSCQNYRSNALPYLNFGKYFLEAGDYVAAEVAFRKALQFSILLPEAVAGLKQVEMRKENQLNGIY